MKFIKELNREIDNLTSSELKKFSKLSIKIMFICCLINIFFILIGG